MEGAGVQGLEGAGVQGLNDQVKGNIYSDIFPRVKKKNEKKANLS